MCSNRPSVRYVSSILEVPETQNCTAFVRGGAKLYWIYPILAILHTPPLPRCVGGVSLSQCNCRTTNIAVRCYTDGRHPLHNGTSMSNWVLLRLLAYVQHRHTHGKIQGPRSARSRRLYNTPMVASFAYQSFSPCHWRSSCQHSVYYTYT